MLPLLWLRGFSNLWVYGGTRENLLTRWECGGPEVEVVCSANIQRPPSLNVCTLPGSRYSRNWILQKEI